MGFTPPPAVQDKIWNFSKSISQYYFTMLWMKWQKRLRYYLWWPLQSIYNSCSLKTFICSVILWFINQFHLSSSVNKTEHEQKQTHIFIFPSDIFPYLPRASSKWNDTLNMIVKEETQAYYSMKTSLPSGYRYLWWRSPVSLDYMLFDTTLSSYMERPIKTGSNAEYSRDKRKYGAWNINPQHNHCLQTLWLLSPWRPFIRRMTLPGTTLVKSVPGIESYIKIGFFIPQIIKYWLNAAATSFVIPPHMWHIPNRG